MDPITQKVLQRLSYEKLLYTTSLAPRRARITLEEIFHAAEHEPRVAQVLPGLVIFKPTAIAKLNRDLSRHAELKKAVEHLFNEQRRPREFMGQAIQDCAKAALTFQKYLESKKGRQKSRTITLRLSPADYQKLIKLSRRMGHGYSETIRRLVEERDPLN